MEELVKRNKLQELLPYILGSAVTEKVNYKITPILYRHEVYSYRFAYINKSTGLKVKQNVLSMLQKMMAHTDIEYFKKKSLRTILDQHVDYCTNLKNGLQSNRVVISWGKTADFFFVCIVPEDKNKQCNYLDIILQNDINEQMRTVEVIRNHIENSYSLFFNDRKNYL